MQPIVLDSVLERGSQEPTAKDPTHMDPLSLYCYSTIQ